MSEHEPDEHGDDDSSTDLPLERRQYLKLTGTAATLGLGSAALSGGASASETRDGFTFETVYDAVNDLGMDPTGSEQIDSKLTSAAGDGVLIKFPSGTYLCGSVTLKGYTTVGIVAKDGADVTFKAADNGGDWINFRNCREALLEGIDFDMTASDDAGGTVNMQSEGPWVLRDVRKFGRHPDTVGAFRLSVDDSSATGIAERCEARDGSVPGEWAVGVFVPTAHSGEVYVRDFAIEDFSNNGIYASAPYGDGNGPVKVEGGYWANNNISNIRLGSPGSYAKGADILVDDPVKGGDGGSNPRGFYIRGGGDDIVLKNNDVKFTAGSSYPVCIGGAADGTGCRVDDNRIGNDIDEAAIYLNSDVAGGWDGSGNHLTGSGNLSAPDGWVECSGSGCDEPNISSDTSSESTFAVSTNTTTSVGETTATLEGSLDSLGGASSADAGFEYRQTGASSWNATSTQSLSSTGTYSQQIDGLTAGTEYEFRATATASDGDTATGSATTFTTDQAYDHHLVIETSSGTGLEYAFTTTGAVKGGDMAEVGNNDSITQNSDGTYTVEGLARDGYDDDWYFDGDVLSWDATKVSGYTLDYSLVLDGTSVTADELTVDAAPSIDRYEVTEAGSPNPHADVTVEWDVSDSDGDLSAVEVEVFDANGNSVASTTNDVDGDVAYGVDYFKIKNVSGQTFDVIATVHDANGNTDSATRSVTESSS